MSTCYRLTEVLLDDANVFAHAPVLEICARRARARLAPRERGELWGGAHAWVGIEVGLQRRVWGGAVVNAAHTDD